MQYLHMYGEKMFNLILIWDLIKKQECIPVGCVPSAAVAFLGGVCPGGVCQGGVPAWECLPRHLPCEQNHRQV